MSCEHASNGMDCSDMYNCCDCGGDVDNGCGCAYCWSCNACESCLDESEED
jgi:hypothetical protein